MPKYTRKRPPGNYRHVTRGISLTPEEDLALMSLADDIRATVSQLIRTWIDERMKARDGKGWEHQFEEQEATA